jgi:hypothetical protein
LKRKDEEKKEACLREGITLIHVPHWWDRTEASIVATIKTHCPDLWNTSISTTKNEKKLLAAPEH